MKFRQFEFRLFPRIRSRKKKKIKLSHPDYPRDISLDKNCNFYKSEFPCFYDNLAADAEIAEQFPEYIFRRSKCAVFDTFDKSSNDSAKTFPFRELKININNTCCCAGCLDMTDHVSSLQTTCGMFSDTCTGTSMGTPNTIPRARTRIKTNPWLPSPRSTPSPSPIDYHQQPFAYPAEYDESDNMYVTRPTTLPLFSSYNSEFRASVRQLTTTSNGLAEIPEHGMMNDGLNRKLLDTGEECLYKTINKGNTTGEERLSPLKKVLADDPSYETDVSSSSTPLSEFLKFVKYEVNFSYEIIADDLLESSTFPRDESFNSSINTYADIPEKGSDTTDHSFCPEKLKDDTDSTFEDTNNNMQESIDTGYASVSRDSDFMSSDDEFGMKPERIYEMKDTDDNINDTYEDCHSLDSDDNKRTENISDTTQEYGSHVKRNTDSYNNDIDNETDIDLAIDIDQSSDNSGTSDLEWDNEPMTQTLILEYPLVIPAKNRVNMIDRPIDMEGDSYQLPMKRYNSVKYRTNKGQYSENECSCQRRRSRSLADIELSLDEKVILLREEKTYVQHKIHEAILEEKIRDHQMKIFRLLTGDRKRQLIQKTLHDLKSRLEDQSARLQASYSTVISMQNMYSKRRRDRINEEKENYN